MVHVSGDTPTFRDDTARPRSTSQNSHSSFWSNFSYETNEHITKIIEHDKKLRHELITDPQYFDFSNVKGIFAVVAYSLSSFF